MKAKAVFCELISGQISYKLGRDMVQIFSTLAAPHFDMFLLIINNSAIISQSSRRKGRKKIIFLCLIYYNFWK